MAPGIGPDSDKAQPLDAGNPRGRIGQHLGNTVARDVEMLRHLTLAHAFRVSQPQLQIKVDGINPLALPTNCRKYVGGRLLNRPRQEYPIATVTDFCTAAYTKHCYPPYGAEDRLMYVNATLGWKCN